MSAGTLSRLVRLTRCIGTGERWARPDAAPRLRACPACWRLERVLPPAAPNGDPDIVPPHSPNPAGR